MIGPLLLLVAAALCIGCRATAQVVHLANRGAVAWSGWHRMNVDTMPAAASGWRFVAAPITQPVGGTPITGGGQSGEIAVEYVRGRRTGLDTWAVDVWCKLQPGQQLDVDLATLTPHDRPLPQLPADLFGWFAGVPAINGVPMGLVAIAIDGAAWTSHWRVRTGRMLVVDFWCTWYPQTPYVLGEAMVTASNPNVPDLTETTAADVRLEFGDAVVLVLGHGQPGLLVSAGTKFGDGQARAMPLTAIWLRNLDAAKWSAQLDSFLVDQARAIGGVGVDRLSMDGRPRLPPGFNVATWVDTMLPPVLAGVHSWAPSIAGPAPYGSTTGEQTWDQVFVRGEPFVAGGVGSEIVAYFGALKQAARPSHHREADGAPLTPSRHTAQPLIFWHGRPSDQLWNLVDHLGKPRAINWDSTTGAPMPGWPETNGWDEADVEHWLIGSLAAATRITGSPCCQELLANEARRYPLEWTTTAGWSNSFVWASRAVGYEYLNAVQLWRCLDDRELAEAVRTHSLARWQFSTRPGIGSRTFWYDGFEQYGKVSLWQQAVGAYGLWLWGTTFGVPEAVDVAMAGARNALQFGFYQDTTTDRWLSLSTNVLPMGAVDPALLLPGGAVKPDANIFYLFGYPMAAWLCRAEPRGGAIWAQMQADASLPKHFQWFAPQ